MAKAPSTEQMSAELREKGRQAFLEPSEVKQRMYHGTARDISQFKPKQAGASFVTPNPKFAHDFADLSESWMKRNAGTILTGEQIERAKDLTAKELSTNKTRRNMRAFEREIALIGSPQALPNTQTIYANKLAEQLPSAQNIMPVHVQAKKPFDYENPKHVHAVRTMLHKLGHTQHIDDFDTAMSGDYAHGANWQTIESKPVQQAIRALGHDSFWVKEGGVKNLGVYNPGAIKSAVGNRGTYDTEDYDINKAQGGAVAPVKLKEGKQPPYQDPKTSKIDEWIWHPMERIRQELSARRELPEHVGPYADYMREMNAKAQSGELTPRDFVKAYTITQSSIGRGGLSHATATKRGMKLPNTGGEVRPEGAFAEWLGSPMGQKYLEASMRGEDHPEALADLREKFAPFGKQNAQVEAMQYATQNAPSLSERLNKAITGSKADYRKFAGGIKGIASAKSGFIGSLLGRGDLPTLDARQLNLHSLSHPTKTPEGMMSRGKGLGGQEAVDRLIARQEALGYNIPNELKPYEQHLIHHDVWDQRGGTQTTHKDLTKAMLGYGDGGSVEKMRQALMVKHFAKGGSEKKWPANLPPAPAPSNQEMNAIVDRIARQQLGEHVTEPGKTENLAGRSIREAKRVKQTQYTTTPTQAVRPTPIYTGQKGDVNVVLPGDQTISDQRLVEVNGLPIGSNQEGGSRYGEGKLHLPENERPFWASGIAPAQGFQNRVTELAQITGQDPRVIAHHLAMGHAGNNFALHFADANLKAVNNSKIKPENHQTFNAIMKQGFADRDRQGNPIQVTFPKWPGVENPNEAYEAMRADPEMRKFFNKTMKLGNVTKALGFPNGSDIEYAISEPELRNMEINMTGHAVGQMRPGAKLVPGAEHNTYSHKILGTSLGRAPELAPMELAFMDATHYIKPKLSSPGAYTRTMSLSAPHQVVDDRYLNIMNDYYTKLRAVRGYAKGGNVSMDEMLAHTTLAKKGPNVRNIGADEAPDMKVKQYIPPGPGDGIGLPSGGVDFQPEMPGQQLSQAVPAGPGGPTMPGMPGMPPGGPGMPPGGPGPGMPGMPPPLPRNQPGMPTGKPAGLEPPNIPPPKQKPTGSNILTMTPQGQALAALGPMRKMADGGSVEQMKRELAKKKDQPIVASRAFQEAPEPTKTTKAYKLFRTHPKHPGKLFPLFVDANEPIEQGKWLAAQAGEMAGEKVKSKIGPLAYRPGWHAGDLPIATHIGGKSTPGLKKPDVRPDNHVWAEVEMPNDVDWHSEAQRRGTNDKGRVVPVKAHITDQVPTGGHYRYKTNPNMTGNWLIGGSMKVNRVLPDEEVAAINKAAGVADLPRQRPQDLGKLGFGVVKKAEGGGVGHMAGGSLRDKILQDAGVYGARRFERASDEIPNLQRMYSPEALHSAFTGDNAKAVMTMDPAHFENYAAPIIESLTGHKDPTVIKHLGEKFAVPTSEHIKHLATILRKGGFDDVPFLGLDKEEVGLPLMPFIKGHEGRHRSRALTQTGVTKNLVRLLPRAELREPLPRRSQEEYIAALKAELDKNGLVRPEPAGMRQERREPVRLPDIYRGGGGVTLPPSTEQMRQALSARRSNSKA